MPLVRRIPKFGFVPPHRLEYQIVNVSTLNTLVESKIITDGKVNPDVLFRAGAIQKKSAPVKILGDGDLKSKLEINAHAFSKSALQKIEKAGGTAVNLSSSKKK